MDGIGEIDGCGAPRQGDQIALGREAEHLVLKHLQLGVLQELLRSRRMFQDIEQFAQPAILPTVEPRRVLLEAPMGGNA